MNIRFENLDIEGFRSIDRINLKLSDQGIVIVKGINNYEELASSNGSGKSSIFEAIIYALFEETSSGDKDIENRILGQGCTIVLQFSIDSVSYKIIRQCKKGKGSVVLYKNNEDISARTKTDTNKLIIDILGINKSLFLDSIFLSQNAITNLPSLSPTARKERLEILTNTDNAINNFKIILKEKQLQYEALYTEAKMQLNKILGKKESLNQQKLKLEQQIKDIDILIEERNKLGNIEELENEISNINTLISNISNSIKEIDVDIESIKSNLNDYRLKKQELENNKEIKNKELDNQRQLCNNIQFEIDKIGNEIKHNNTNINNIEIEILKIKNSDTCPTCGRKYENINEDHINNLINEKNDEIANINSQIKEYKNQIENYNNNLNIEVEKGKLLRKAYDDSLNEILEFNNSITDIENKLTSKSNDKIKLLNEIQMYQNKINQINLKINEIKEIEIPNKTQYLDMLKDIETQFKELENNENVKNEEIENLDNYINTIKHCSQLVVKDFRTFLLKNSLLYLNKVLKNYSSQLFSNESDVISISENDNKLDIMLGNATYESLSGGEKTRVNIALLLAQKSLANMIGNISCNLIILDEILGYCDALAENNVINLITSELDSLETIYMISHKEIPVGYDMELIVEKDNNGLTHLKSY